MANERSVSFEFDKYNKAKLSDRKTTVANTIVNACFMVPGNNPTNPTEGVNIKQYFYKDEKSISSDKVKTDLERTCGKIIAGATIGAIDFSTQKTSIGDTVFLLAIVINWSINQSELLAITMKQTTNNYVKFNFDYIQV